jgi:hypothetical protein
MKNLTKRSTSADCVVCLTCNTEPSIPGSIVCDWAENKDIDVSDSESLLWLGAAYIILSHNKYTPHRAKHLSSPELGLSMKLNELFEIYAGATGSKGLTISPFSNVNQNVDTTTQEPKKDYSLELPKFFRFINPEEVCAFLQENNQLISILFVGFTQLKKYFADSTFCLEVINDPDSDPKIEYLLMTIQTKLSCELAILARDTFLKEWWIKNQSTTRRKLALSLEFEDV